MKLNYKKSITISIMIALISLSTGCKSLNNSFECPMKPGVMCKSLDQVNDMVDQGQIASNGSKNSCPTCAKSKITAASKLTSFNTPFPSQAGIEPGQPLRYNESVMGIWVAPYEDTDGNYHQESTVFTVVKPGHWIGVPVVASQ